MSLANDLTFENSIKSLSHKSLKTSKSSNLLLTEYFSSRSISEWSMANNNRSVGLHRIFQYPAMMVPEVQQKIVKVFTAINPEIKNMVDPFMGGGTAITAGLYNGLNCHGQDINPLSILVSKVKTANYDLKYLEQSKQFIRQRYFEGDRKEITVEFPGRDRWFEKKVSKDLSKLRESIKLIPELKYRQFFWVLLAETIRLSSNDRTSTYKLHRRDAEEIKRRSKLIDVYTIFTNLYQQVHDDLKVHSLILKEIGNKDLKVSIKLIDSTKKIEAITKNTKYDLVITSPPYGDNKTTVPYGQHSYLPLQWIPLHDIDKHAEESLLSSTNHIDGMSLGGKLNAMDEKALDILLGKSNALKKSYSKLKDDPRMRYKKVINFFSDFDKVLDKLKNVTNKDAYQAIIIGNRTVGSLSIPNNIILRELLEANDFSFVTEFHRNIHNKRMPKKNDTSTTMNTEKIIVSCKNEN